MSGSQAVQALQIAVQSHGGEVLPSGPMSGTYFIKYGKFTTTFGMKVRMDGAYTIRPTPSGGSRVSLQLSCSFGSIVPILILLLIIGLCLGPMVIVAAIGDFFVWQQFNSQIPTDIVTQLLSKLGSGGAMAADLSPPASPISTTGPRVTETSGTEVASNQAPVSGAPSQPVSAQEDVFEALRKLANLLEVGAITQDEYQAKKAQYLARL